MSCSICFFIVTLDNVLRAHERTHARTQTWQPWWLLWKWDISLTRFIPHVKQGVRRRESVTTSSFKMKRRKERCKLFDPPPSVSTATSVDGSDFHAGAAYSAAAYLLQVFPVGIAAYVSSLRPQRLWRNKQLCDVDYNSLERNTLVGKL